MLTYIIGDGTVQSANEVSDSLGFSDQVFQAQITCSPSTDSICYSTFYNATSIGVTYFTRFDFSSFTTIKYAQFSGSGHHTSSNYAMNDDEGIFAGFNLGANVIHTMIRYNFTSDAIVWAVNANAPSK